MAAFDPATIHLLREQLRETNAQHKRDLDQLRKFQPNSKDSRAEALRERIGKAVRVGRDLEWLLDLTQRLTDQADRHAAERTAAGLDPAGPLSHTPLATAFGAAPAAEPRDPEAGAR